MENTFLPAARFHVLTPLYEHMVRPFMGRAWKRIAEEVAKRAHSGGHVVDLGCGPGSILRLIRTLRPDLQLTGLDIDPRVISIAKRRATKANIAFRAASIERTILPDSSMDIVLSTLMFHHLSTQTKTAAFQEIRRILKPEGLFLLCDFSIPPKRTPWLELRWWKYLEPEIEPQLQGQLLELGREAHAEVRTLWTIFGCISLHLFRFST